MNPEQKTATHFLSFSFDLQSDQESIREAFFNRLDGRKHEVVFAPGDSSEITWNIHSDGTFWTVSRLAEPYVVKMTVGLVRKVYKEVYESQKLDKDFQFSMLVTKNLSDTIK